MNISIRRGNEEDSDLISRIDAESWKNAYKGMALEEYLKNLMI